MSWRHADGTRGLDGVPNYHKNHNTMPMTGAFFLFMVLYPDN